MVLIRVKEENSEQQCLMLEEVSRKLYTEALQQRQHMSEKDEKILEAEMTALKRKALCPEENIDYSIVCPFKGQKIWV